MASTASCQHYCRRDRIRSGRHSEVDGNPSTTKSAAVFKEAVVASAAGITVAAAEFEMDGNPSMTKPVAVFKKAGVASAASITADATEFEVDGDPSTKKPDAVTMKAMIALACLVAFFVAGAIAMRWTDSHRQRSQLR